ncbi:uncharacterized protein LOC129409376 isoform X1 [Boleophthalmus pectinirostris]|uniref:uncharacterized protein LOC129409376 isoform X1 n=1 Tax=Boleophthalmus pectinirostris TaxID=150288 RepID=UPI002430AB96|nr:uncharacterized protein LOC129409376 isoform X1 [Boleophthalmus pectinirostris]XP_055011193.1 uncharacterized protein LOC129409376 isoform X1 [Boleophthalmus pectinirostris]
MPEMCCAVKDPHEETKRYQNPFSLLPLVHCQSHPLQLASSSQARTCPDTQPEEHGHCTMWTTMKAFQKMICSQLDLPLPGNGFFPDAGGALSQTKRSLCESSKNTKKKRKEDKIRACSHPLDSRCTHISHRGTQQATTEGIRLTRYSYHQHYHPHNQGKTQAAPTPQHPHPCPYTKPDREGRGDRGRKTWLTTGSCLQATVPRNSAERWDAAAEGGPLQSHVDNQQAEHLTCSSKI